MGIDFAIGCKACKEFITLHKWGVVEAASQFLVNSYFDPSDPSYDPAYSTANSPYPIEGLDSSSHFVLLNSQKVLSALDDTASEPQHIRDLVPMIREFANSHSTHVLFLTCDFDVLPWEPWHVDGNFFQWKEIPHYAGDFHRYLPRNLIEDLKLTSWQEAEEYLKREHDWLPKDAKGQILEAFEQSLGKAI